MSGFESNTDDGSGTTGLSAYTSSGTVADITSFEVGSDSSVVDAFETIQAFRSIVRVDGINHPLVVGRYHKSGRDTSYTLWHQPNKDSQQGYAGRLLFRKQFGDNTPSQIVTFQHPSSSSDGSAFQLVTDLGVQPDHRTDDLKAVLPKLRTDLTSVDWTSTDQPETRFRDWKDATIVLEEFIDSQRENGNWPAAFEIGALALPKVSHELARYPHGAEEMLRGVEAAITTNDLRQTASPIGFRYLLLKYAAEHLE